MDQNIGGQGSGAGAPMGAPSTEAQKGGMGPLVGAIIIIALLVFGGLYFWGIQLERQAMQQDLPLMVDENAGAPAQASDEPAAIEQELNEAEMARLQAEIDADIKALETDLGSI